MTVFRTLAAAAALLFVAWAPAAMAQEEMDGAYCGPVTWEGEAPQDMWILFMDGNTWSSAGAIESGGEVTRAGTMVTMNGGVAFAGVMRGEMIEGVAYDGGGRRAAITLNLIHSTGQAAPDAPLPPVFIVDSARAALAGEMQGLASAITWAWTEQGIEYWSPIYESGGPLPSHAQVTMRNWIRLAEQGEIARCHPHP